MAKSVSVKKQFELDMAKLKASFSYKEVTDYKSDFPESFKVVEEITRRLTPQTPTDTITPLLTKLNSQVANKDYNGAKDTTSYLLNEFSKLK